MAAEQTKTKDQLSASGVETGPPVLPHQRVQLMSPDDWEGFVDEWANSLKPDLYKRVERRSGAGDKGIDVCAYVEADDLFSPWDNFQCKHYDKALAPSHGWIELAKVIYYTWKGEYSVPRKYYFCAPRDVGSSLALLLRRPNELKEKLRETWDKSCRDQLIAKQSISLTGDLLAYFETFDFSIFSYKPIAELIEQHRKTRHFVLRFGGGLPPRPDPEQPPPTVASHEVVYTGELLAAYSERLAAHIASVSEITQPELQRHFERSRREFYCAEGLRVFSHDNLTPQEYERLQGDVFHAIQDTLDDEVHVDGYDRVRAVVKHAKTLEIDSHPLKSRMNPTDRAGVCHQLANNGRVRWCKKAS